MKIDIIKEYAIRGVGHIIEARKQGELKYLGKILEV